jgi:hypothetical protein
MGRLRPFDVGPSNGCDQVDEGPLEALRVGSRRTLDRGPEAGDVAGVVGRRPPRRMTATVYMTPTVYTTATVYMTATVYTTATVYMTVTVYMTPKVYMTA